MFSESSTYETIASPDSFPRSKRVPYHIVRAIHNGKWDVQRETICNSLSDIKLSLAVGKRKRAQDFYQGVVHNIPPWTAKALDQAAELILKSRGVQVTRGSFEVPPLGFFKNHETEIRALFRTKQQAANPECSDESAQLLATRNARRVSTDASTRKSDRASRKRAPSATCCTRGPWVDHDVEKSTEDSLKLLMKQLEDMIEERLNLLLSDEGNSLLRLIRAAEEGGDLTGLVKGDGMKGNFGQGVLPGTFLIGGKVRSPDWKFPLCNYPRWVHRIYRKDQVKIGQLVCQGMSTPSFTGDFITPVVENDLWVKRSYVREEKSGDVRAKPLKMEAKPLDLAKVKANSQEIVIKGIFDDSDLEEKEKENEMDLNFLTEMEKIIKIEEAERDCLEKRLGVLENLQLQTQVQTKQALSSQQVGQRGVTSTDGLTLFDHDRGDSGESVISGLPPYDDVDKGILIRASTKKKRLLLPCHRHELATMTRDIPNNDWPVCPQTHRRCERRFKKLLGTNDAEGSPSFLFNRHEQIIQDLIESGKFEQFAHASSKRPVSKLLKEKCLC